MDAATPEAILVPASFSKDGGSDEPDEFGLAAAPRSEATLDSALVVAAVPLKAVRAVDESNGIRTRPKMSLEATLIMTVTAYTNHDVNMDGLGVMTSGLTTFDGACACGPSWPFGAVFYVPILQRGCICQDRGGAIGDRNLDFWMADREDALRFGVKRAEVIVLYSGRRKRRSRLVRLGHNQPEIK